MDASSPAARTRPAATRRTCVLADHGWGHAGPAFKHPPPQLEGVPPATAMCLLAKEAPAEVAITATAAGAGTAAAPAPEAVPAPSGRQSMEAQLTSTSQPSQPGSRTGSSVPAALAAITRPFTSLMGKGSGRTSPAVQASQEQRTSK